MIQVIFFSSKDAEKAANVLVAIHPSYTIVNGAIDDRSGAEEAECFRQQVGSWSGTVAAFQVEDEHGQIVAKYGYWE